MFLVALLVGVSLAEASGNHHKAPVNPYLLRNYTGKAFAGGAFPRKMFDAFPRSVCPGFFTSHGFLPCSGQGDCDNRTGECSCLANFK